MVDFWCPTLIDRHRELEGTLGPVIQDKDSSYIHRIYAAYGGKGPASGGRQGVRRLAYDPAIDLRRIVAGQEKG